MIEFQKVYDGLNSCKDIYPKLCKQCPYKDVCYTHTQGCDSLMHDAFYLLAHYKKIIDEQPKIVRCKDCKHFEGGGIDGKDNFIPPKCKLFDQPTTSNWFCANGEDKE